MKSVKHTATVLLAVLLAGPATALYAQRHDGPPPPPPPGRGGYVRHNEWRRGYRMRQDDWRRGQRVDWRARHLRQPPRGYEWREVDGNYVMAAVATGIIASAIMAASH